MSSLVTRFMYKCLRYTHASVLCFFSLWGFFQLKLSSYPYGLKIFTEYCLHKSNTYRYRSSCYVMNQTVQKRGTGHSHTYSNSLNSTLPPPSSFIDLVKTKPSKDNFRFVMLRIASSYRSLPSVMSALLIFKNHFRGEYSVCYCLYLCFDLVYWGTI